MADYSQVISNAPAPATADVSLLTRGNETIAKGVLGLGQSIFDAQQGISKGMSLQELQNAQMDDRNAMVESARTVAKDMQAFPVDKKLALDSVTVNLSPEDILDENVTSQDVKTIFDQKRSGVLASFEKEAQRISEAMSQLPARRNEYMMKSQRRLQDFIAANPGLGQDARAIFAETFGIKQQADYDMEKINESIDAWTKQQAAQQKAQEEARSKFVDLYVQDRVRQGFSATVAYQEAQANPAMVARRMEAFEYEKTAEDARKKISLNTEDEVARYGAATTLSVTAKTSKLSLDLMASLKEEGLNLTPGQLADPDLDPRISTDPRFIKHYNKFRSDMLGNVMQAEAEGIAQIQASLPVLGREATDRALAAFQTRMKALKDTATNSPLSIASQLGSTAGTVKQQAEMLGNLQKLAGGLGINPDILVALTTKEGNARYPNQSQAIQYLQEAGIALANGDPQSHYRALEKLKVAMAEAPGSVAATKEQKVAKTLRVEQSKNTILNFARDEKGDPRVVKDAMIGYARDVISNRSFGDDAVGFMTNLRLAQDKLRTKDPAAAEEFTDAVTSAMNGALYAQGTGEAKQARNLHDKLAKVLGPRGGAVVFATPDGSEPLAFDADKLRPVGIAGRWHQPDRTIFKAANEVLANAEHALMFVSRVTGTKMPELRRQFMADFVSGRTDSKSTLKGIDDEVSNDSSPATSKLAGATPFTGTAGGSGVTLGADKQRTQANIDALKREISVWEKRKDAGAAGALSILRQELANEEALLK